MWLHGAGVAWGSQRRQRQTAAAALAELVSSKSQYVSTWSSQASVVPTTQPGIAAMSCARGSGSGERDRAAALRVDHRTVRADPSLPLSPSRAQAAGAGRAFRRSRSHATGRAGVPSYVRCVGVQPPPWRVMTLRVYVLYLLLNAHGMTGGLCPAPCSLALLPVPTHLPQPRAGAAPHAPALEPTLTLVYDAMVHPRSECPQITEIPPPLFCPAGVAPASGACG
jgi:hypothetical protein